MRNDLVSVIIPIYNGEKYIHNCINSIINQTYKNIEIILVNDGSTDNSRNLCELFLKKDNRITFINKRNLGPSAARNSGIKIAKGEFIQFVDIDDYLELNMIEKLTNYFNTYSDLIICDFNIINSENVLVPNINREIYNDYLDKFSFNKKFIYYYELSLIKQPWNKIYRKSIIADNNFRFDTDLRYAEDLIFNLNYLEKCRSIQFISDKLYNYHVGIDNSLTINFKHNFFENRLSVYKKIFIYINKNNINANSKFSYYFFKEVVSCFNNLFHLNSDLKVSEKYIEITNIVYNSFVEKICRDLERISLLELVLKYLINCKAVTLIYVLFCVISKLKRISSKMKFPAYRKRVIY